MTTASIISQEGVITLFHNGRQHIVPPAHVNHEAIVEALNDEDYDALDGLLDVPTSIRAIDGRIRVEGDRVFFNDFEVVGTVAERLIQFLRERLPTKPIVRFIEHLLANPSRRSVTELYGFLEHKGLPIDPAGFFFAYKGIREDWTDCHSGKFDNRPGNVHSMPRAMVDDDFRRACSVGFHVGTQEYASSFAGHGGRVVLVRVNPEHAVSVPYDHSEQKLRVCEYEVVQEIDKSTILDVALVTADNLPSMPDDAEEIDEDYCYDCGEDDAECVC